MNPSPTYVLDRLFPAPPETVWNAWTTPDLVSQWYGPGVETVIHSMEVRPSGLWLVEMRWGGQGHFQRAEYTEVEEHARLVWLHSSADAEWNVIANPMMPDWPRQLLTTVTFEAEGDGTRVKLIWEPYEASDAEVACFAEAMAAPGQGWVKGFDLLEEMLSQG